MAPSIDGEVHWFAEHGLYDGLFLMRDEQTGTYWDHMTGDAVYGPMVGESLEVMNLTQTTVAQVLSRDPDAMVTLSDQGIRTDEQMALGGLLGGVRRGLNRMFASTVKEEDDRRPTMDMGMGVWHDEQARYYPHETVIANDNGVFDEIDGRRIIVYLDPTAYALAAAFTEADSFTWDEKVLRFSDGTFIENGLFHDASGARAEIDRPLQVFTRWYGFSLTFPHTEIFEVGN
jgi:uncharacterized protein DUF3179